jgi:hypothetical protein
MAMRLIEKGGLGGNGMRKLILHIQDADNTWREEPFAEVSDAEADAKIEELLRSGQVHGTWPPVKAG